MSTNEKQFRFKREWKLEGKHFNLVVSCHEEDRSQFSYDGPYRWCIYVYVYPKYKLFGEFDPDGGMWDQPGPQMHGGYTYFRPHYAKDGTITSFQIGCDYNHIYDDHHTREFMNDTVFRDAQEIFRYMEEYGSEPVLSE